MRRRQHREHKAAWSLACVCLTHHVKMYNLPGVQEVEACRQPTSVQSAACSPARQGCPSDEGHEAHNSQPGRRSAVHWLPIGGGQLSDADHAWPALLTFGYVNGYAPPQPQLPPRSIGLMPAPERQGERPRGPGLRMLCSLLWRAAVRACSRRHLPSPELTPPLLESAPTLAKHTLKLT